MYEEKKEGNVLVVNARISGGQMEQLVVIVAVCPLAILKRMPATPLTLLREQVQRSGKIKT